MRLKIPKFDYLWQYIPYWAQQDPEFPAIHYQGQTITARQLDEKVNQLAKAFLRLGVQKGDTIVTVLSSVPAFVLTFFAASRIGAITVPMDVRYRPADYRRLVPHVEPKVIVSIARVDEFDVAAILQEVSAEFSQDIHYLMTEPSAFGQPFDALFDLPLDLDAELKAAQEALQLDDGSLVVFTGGTTGVPKAAMLSHRNCTETVFWETEYILDALEAQDVTGRIPALACLPPSHVGGTLEMIGTAIYGGWELYMMDRWSPYPVLDITVEKQMPWIGGVPTMLAIICALPDLEKYDLRCIRLVMMSGEKVGLDLLQDIAAKICPNIIDGWGSTESGAEVTFTRVGDDFQKIADGYVGKPLGEQKVRIVDDQGRDLPPGQEGEIVVTGTMTIRSYFRMPQEDQAGFTADGWCRTGDLGYMTEDGGVYIKGRRKHIIRVGAYTVLPTEVEEVAVQHPSVAMAVAMGVPDKTYGEVLWLVVVPESEQSISEEALVDYMKSQLANYKVPRKVIIRSEIPTTRIGKADRLALAKEILNA